MIYIFGDSFSSNRKGWPGIIGALSTGNNGSSEYRILKSYQSMKSKIKPDDKVVFCHTHWSRVYLRDNQPSLSRLLSSHPLCDLIFKDVFEKQEQQFVQTLETIWDEEFFRTVHSLLIKELLLVPNSLHLTFFEDLQHAQITNMSHVWRQYPGKINHLTDQGNSVVAAQVQTLNRF